MMPRTTYVLLVCGLRVRLSRRCVAELVPLTRPALTCDDSVLRVQDGGTALMRAAHGGHADMVETLIEAGADVNATDKVSATRVHCPFSVSPW